MFGQLVPCGGGNPIPLFAPRLVVGRTSECDVSLPYGTISSKHCLLELRDGTWFVSDLGSRNGVRIDGVRCQEGRLVPGSILWVAQQRYQVEYASKGGASPATAKPTPSVPPADTIGAPQPRAAPPTPQPRRRPFAGGYSAELGELLPCGGGDAIPLTKASLVVGRSPACDITLAFPIVSAKHCQLEFKDGFWHVRDLGSRNGIRVDGVFQLAKYLKPGEILSIAKLRFEIAYTPQADEPPPEENPFALSLLEKAGLAGRGAAAAQPALPPLRDEEPLRKKWSIDENDEP